ncbi:hypothetical protein [Flavobacterium sp. SLB02]|uniref:hypothetical protein n=1 Tax=Flavobacterium sp. SLB02 TaxID=2665645 RepID=UPI0012A7A7F0|nr:hypothetical protein [Flavobacterium sp. SLB02]QGK73442.1 hypothetical protein GIY83_05005 [Flavobacterium sp. SLB02]
MSEQSILRLMMSATVSSNEWEKLEEFMAAARIAVQKEGDGVLIHECHYNPQTLEIIFLESYADQNELMKHAQSFATVMNEHKVEWIINRIDLLGNYSEELFAMMKGLSDGAQVNLYKKVFKNK